MAMRMRYINIALHPFQKREQNISYFQSISICSNYFIRLNSLRIGGVAEHLLRTCATVLYWEFRSHEFHWTTASNVRPILMDFSLQFLLGSNFCSCSIVCVLFGVCYVLWNGKWLPHDTRQLFWISIVESNRFSLYFIFRHFSANTMRTWDCAKLQFRFIHFWVFADFWIYKIVTLGIGGPDSFRLLTIVRIR